MSKLFGCVGASALVLFLFVAMRDKSCEVPREIVEYDDTDAIVFCLSSGRSNLQIASDVSNVTVFCQSHTKRWDNGLNMDRIHGFRRIASFDDRDSFVRIMERCRRSRVEEETGGDNVYRRDLPMYYIVFYYWKRDHVMVFPVKFDEQLLGNITPWSKTNYTYSNRDMFRWLKELSEKCHR